MKPKLLICLISVGFHFHLDVYDCVVSLLKEVSVVVSTYSKDKLSQVLDCIKSLKCQSLPPKEIILVLDPDKDLVDFYKSCIPDGVKIVVSNQYGLSEARNTGVRNAEAEIIAFIDDDAMADAS